jgi:hypothetical protein
MEFMSRAPETWTKEEVGSWLNSIDLPQYKANFEGINLDGSLLFQIQDEDLQTDLGVGVRLHRVKILEQIKKLGEQQLAIEPEIYHDISQPTELDYEEDEEDNESYEVMS